MQAFTCHSGVAAPLLRVNIDTDAIIPSREMKTVGKRGLSAGLFAGWRYLNPASRDLNPEFVLNQDDYAKTSILLSGANFGCGSSREHAVWALLEYGIRCIITSSFGSIFYNNCIRNGILPIVLSDAQIQDLSQYVTSAPKQNLLYIDLQQCLVKAGDSDRYEFSIAANYRKMLLEGLDPIGLTLQQLESIDTFIEKDRRARPWAAL